MGKHTDYFQIKSIKDFVKLVLISVIIATITFVLAIFSDFSVKMFYGQMPHSANISEALQTMSVNIVGGLFALLFMSIVLFIILLFSTPLRLTLQSMFGVDKIELLQIKREEQIKDNMEKK